MTWDQIRAACTDLWIVAEVLRSHIQDGRYVVEELALVGRFVSSGDAMRRQFSLRRAEPSREVLTAFTGWETLEIENIVPARGSR